MKKDIPILIVVIIDFPGRSDLLAALLRNDSCVELILYMIRVKLASNIQNKHKPLQACSLMLLITLNDLILLWLFWLAQGYPCLK